MVEINGERLIQSLREVAKFGAFKSGVHRPTYSEQDMKARRWLMDKMRVAGLQASMDGVGNVIGKSNRPGSALLVGSHSESQNQAGWLDGILGVMYGLELAQSIEEQNLDLAVDVGAWADEECHYLQFLGSRSYCGDLREEEIDAACNKDSGEPLRDALKRVGLLDRPRQKIDTARYVGYLEAHIEQGEYMDSQQLAIGIVTSIVGLWQYRISFEGQQDHAGATRMAIRRDAGAALVRLATRIEERFKEVAAERSVWTIGRIILEPGAPSIIPGGAEMLFQFRDENLDQLNLFERELIALVGQADREGPCGCKLHTVDLALPKKMSAGMQQDLEDAAKVHTPDKHVRMPSGAAHDAQIFAQVLPAAMLFVPSIGGVSHHYTEDTKEEDIIAGCRVFADAAERSIRRASLTAKAARPAS